MRNVMSHGRVPGGAGREAGAPYRLGRDADPSARIRVSRSHMRALPTSHDVEKRHTTAADPVGV